MSWNNKEEIETTCTVQQRRQWRWKGKPCLLCGYLHEFLASEG